MSIKCLRKFLAVTVAALVAGGAAGAEEPDFISLGAGYFDFNRQKDEGGEFRLEYRSRVKLGPFKPFAAASATTSGHFLFSGGILMDLFFGRRVVITPSFAPGYYTGGNSDLDLGHELEFRSQIEFAYRFDDRSRLGLAVSHTSNASIGDNNPGSESAILYYSLPIESLFGD